MLCRPSGGTDAGAATIHFLFGNSHVSKKGTPAAQKKSGVRVTQTPPRPRSLSRIKGTYGTDTFGAASGVAPWVRKPSGGKGAGTGHPFSLFSQSGSHFHYPGNLKYDLLLV
jgi:hypothetical protein